MSELDRYLSRIRPGRKITGVAAALLPFDARGEIAEEAFDAHLRATQVCGLTNAVNMDTGYVNLLTPDERRRVLELTRDALGPGARFLAGAYIDGREGNVVRLYRDAMDEIAGFGGTPVLIQTRLLHGALASVKVAAYREACAGFPEAIAFELSPVFAPNGEIFDEETVAGLMEIPALTGMKHSSLSRVTELQRLELRDRLRPDFRIYTGNDLGIDMVMYGSDYLLGLATFCPEKFAERDRMWESGDPGYLELNDALQHLGNVAFRSPVPAYKHSAAIFLHMQGRIPTDLTHTESPNRHSWEHEILADCAFRLGLPVKRSLYNTHLTTPVP